MRDITQEQLLRMDQPLEPLRHVVEILRETI